jgi:hypothetical protein
MFHKEQMVKYDYSKIHRHCGWHENEVMKSEKCGCFSCLKIFPASDIVEWIDEPETCPRGEGRTAVCPNCGIDAVLPENAEYELSEGFIKDMGQEFFG